MSSQPPEPLNWLNWTSNQVSEALDRGEFSKILLLIVGITALGFCPDIGNFKGFFTEAVFKPVPNWYGFAFILTETILFILHIIAKQLEKSKKKSKEQTQEKPVHRETDSNKQKNAWRPLLIFSFLLGAAIFILFSMASIFANPPVISELKCNTQKDGDCFSWGETVLIQEKLAFPGEEIWKKDCRDAWFFKQEGANNYSRDAKGAELSFKTFIDKCQNDPEAHIYRSNADAERVGKPFKLAVSVPISRLQGEGVFDSQEILRGVAIAQHQINSQESGVYNNRKLVIGIADDGYEKEKVSLERQAAKDTASFLSRNKEVLGVIGHSSSDASEEAAEVYDQEELVAISPTSTAVRKQDPNDPSSDKINLRKYIFRVASNDEIAARELVTKIADSRYKRIAIIYDGDSLYVRSFKRAFQKVFEEEGGKIVNNYMDLSECDISKEIGFRASPEACLAQVYQTQKADVEAQALLLIPSGDTAALLFRDSTGSNKNNASDKSFIQLNSEKNPPLPLLGSDTAYNEGFLTDAAKDMIVAVPWHRQSEPSDFEKDAKELFGYTNSQTREREPFKVSWETAMAYDATQALIEGIKRSAPKCSWHWLQVWDKHAEASCIRKLLKNALSSTEEFGNFKANGALGEKSIEFDQYGDRRKVEGLGVLVKVCKLKSGQYEFRGVEECP